MPAYPTNSDQISTIENFDQWNTLKNTSRTFYLSIKQLPTKIGNAFCLAYLLLRVSDFFEDNEFMPPEEKVYWLNTWDEVLAGKPFPKDWQEKLKDTLRQKIPMRLPRFMPMSY